MTTMMLKGDYFNGRWVMPSKADETINKKCPGDLSVTLWDAKVSYDHIEPVIASAMTGFETWRKTSLENRIACLKKYQEIVRGKKNDIALALALEVGKPFWEALTEAAALDSKVSVTITDSLERVKQKTIKDVMPKIDGHVVYKPLGPTFVIGPFNFPCHLANGQILSALVAGNSIIFKPSEKTIYSAQLMVDCLHEAGFPAGVINFINGTGMTASKITGDKRVKGVFFTGSRPVGLKILENTWKDIDKLVALELVLRHALIQIIRCA